MCVYIYIHTIHYVVFLYKCIYVPYLQPATHRPMVYWNSGHHLFAGRGGETRIWNPAYTQIIQVYLQNTSVDVFVHSKFAHIYFCIHICVFLFILINLLGKWWVFLLVDWSWRTGLDFNSCFSYSFSTKILKYGFIYACVFFRIYMLVTAPKWLIVTENQQEARGKGVFKVLRKKVVSKMGGYCDRAPILNWYQPMVYQPILKDLKRA